MAAIVATAKDSSGSKRSYDLTVAAQGDDATYAFYFGAGTDAAGKTYLGAEFTFTSQAAAEAALEISLLPIIGAQHIANAWGVTMDGDKITLTRAQAASSNGANPCTRVFIKNPHSIGR